MDRSSVSSIDPPIDLHRLWIHILRTARDGMGARVTKKARRQLAPQGSEGLLSSTGARLGQLWSMSGDWSDGDFLHESS